MKRIFTSLALLCTLLTLNAQDCVFQFEGKPLEDGATVTINAAPDPIFHEPECNTNPADNPANGLFIVNKTSSKLSGSATITISTHTLETGRIQWCMGGSCELVTSTTKTKEFSIPAKDPTDPNKNQTAIQYDCEVKGEGGEMMTKLEATIGGKTYTVYIKFINDPSLHVSATTSAVKPVAYYTLDGRQVSQRPRGVCLVKFSDGRVRKMVSK